jgi:penicillin-binding protein 1A
MRDIHQGLPFKEFVRPATGLIDVKVCAKSGLLWTPGCPGEITLPFLEGTQPRQPCDQHQNQVNAPGASGSLRPGLFDTMSIDLESQLEQIKRVELDIDTLPVRPGSETGTSGANQRRGLNQLENYGIERPDYNPLLE